MEKCITSPSPFFALFAKIVGIRSEIRVYFTGSFEIKYRISDE